VHDRLAAARQPDDHIETIGDLRPDGRVCPRGPPPGGAPPADRRGVPDARQMVAAGPAPRSWWHTSSVLCG